MASFFFELLTEEIPARMQKEARENMKILLRKEFESQRLSFEDIYVFSTPRRLGAHITGLPQEQKAYKEEVRGPRVGGPEVAIVGFLKSQKITSLEQCFQKETSKGNFWIYERQEKSRSTKEVLEDILTHIIQNFPWPKTMRWGEGTLPWIRPLRNILAVFEKEVVSCKINQGAYKIESSSTTVGHRFLSSSPFRVLSYKDYTEKLKQHYVLVNPEERQRILLQRAEIELQKKALSLEVDSDLLEEVTSLVEWPISYIGSIDTKFMTLPREVLTTSMKVHQRYFSLKTSEGRMAPYFLFIANQEGSDQGRTIIHGNEKILAARLTDALFFWEQDQRQTLETYGNLLRNRAFYKGLGTLYDKAKRLEELCSGIFGKAILENRKTVNSQNLLEKGKKVGFLAKADLTTQMVGEFPELQGIMGSYYGRIEGHDDDICHAIYHQYKIDMIEHFIEKYPLSVIVALADRVDTLYGFFSLGLIPTGSKDPFALRRAALGIIEVVKKNHLSVPLSFLFDQAHHAFEFQKGHSDSTYEKSRSFKEVWKDLCIFFAERLRVLLKEEGYAYDTIQASFKEGWEENIPLFFERATALDVFFKESNSQALLFAYRRASSILRDVKMSLKIDSSLFVQQEEVSLFKSLEKVKGKFGILEDKDFAQKFLELSTLKSPLDAFFDHVTVNVADKAICQNRLALLQEVTSLFESVADFSKIEKDTFNKKP